MVILRLAHAQAAGGARHACSGWAACGVRLGVRAGKAGEKRPGSGGEVLPAPRALVPRGAAHRSPAYCASAHWSSAQPPPLPPHWPHSGTMLPVPTEPSPTTHTSTGLPSVLVVGGGEPLPVYGCVQVSMSRKRRSVRSSVINVISTGPKFWMCAKQSACCSISPPSPKLCCGWHCQYHSWRRVQEAPAWGAFGYVPGGASGCGLAAHGRPRTFRAADSRVGSVLLRGSGAQPAAGVPQEHLCEGRSGWDAI